MLLWLSTQQDRADFFASTRSMALSLPAGMCAPCALQAAIAQQATALRKVEVGAHKAQAPRPAEGGLEAALRKGLERFHFDDTRGTTAHGDDTTGDFSMQ